ncbi:MAG: glycogen synthase GlgA [Rhodomicrobium sp.]
MSQLKILSVTSEVYPLIKTGGLADVAGALPHALRAEDTRMITLIPGYPAVMAALHSSEEIRSIPFLFGGSARILSAKAANLDLFVLDAPHLYDRPGNPYVAPSGADWPDNAFRFAALGKIAAAIGRGLIPRFAPDVVHAHDWQAGLAAAYLHYGEKPRPATVITVHNLAYQGQFPANLLGALELPAEALTFNGIEHFGAIGYLKAALQLSDRITTVSPTYAVEIQRPETGMGFDGLLRERSSRLRGILNGVDTEVWNPADDPRIAVNYDARGLYARAANKEALQHALGLAPEPDTLLIGIISRLSWQKGLDLLLDNLPVLLEENMQLAVLGEGDPEIKARFRAAAQSFPGRVGVLIGYDETLAHRIQAGSDAFLVPSRFEPCGLTQLCALRYGAVPVVSRVGGLADTIIDANEMALAAGAATGIQFASGTDDGLALALRKTASLFRDKLVWRVMQTNGMLADVSWRNPARRYAQLYRELLPGQASLDAAA